MANKRQTIEKFIKRLKEPVSMVCETGNKCFWMADIMEDCGVGVHVALEFTMTLRKVPQYYRRIKR